MPDNGVPARGAAGSSDPPESDRGAIGLIDEVNRAFNQLSRDAERRAPLSLGPSSRHPPPLSVGVRNYLAEREGSGYWEFFKPAEHLLVSVTDARYRQTQWIEIPPAPLLKLRMLVAGQLLGAKHEAILTGPEAHLHRSAGTTPEGYFVVGGQPGIKLVVLHCTADFVEHTLGLDHDELPLPVVEMLETRASGSTHRLGINAGVFHAAQRILDSRHTIPSALRCAYLGSMATTILCEVFAELPNLDHGRRSPSRLQLRDRNRIYEGRDYLAQHFVAPPTIPQLARMVGINQTKLKAGFKELLGMTIHHYILQRRMELASELLLTRAHNVTEIAYLVGYEYPTNFTYAFKKYFGRLPRAWKNER
jgi:AraC-like DNA-binding protein